MLTMPSNYLAIGSLRHEKKRDWKDGKIPFGIVRRTARISGGTGMRRKGKKSSDHAWKPKRAKNSKSCVLLSA